MNGPISRYTPRLSHAAGHGEGEPVVSAVFAEPVPGTGDRVFQVELEPLRRQEDSEHQPVLHQHEMFADLS